MKTKYDRVTVPRAYIVRYFEKRSYPKNFVEAIVYFLGGHTLRETREIWEFAEPGGPFYRQAKNIRSKYAKDRRRQPANAFGSNKNDIILRFQ